MSALCALEGRLDVEEREYGRAELCARQRNRQIRRGSCSGDCAERAMLERQMRPMAYVIVMVMSVGVDGQTVRADLQGQGPRGRHETHGNIGAKQESQQQQGCGNPTSFAPVRSHDGFECNHLSNFMFKCE